METFKEVAAFVAVQLRLDQQNVRQRCGLYVHVGSLTSAIKEAKQKRTIMAVMGIMTINAPTVHGQSAWMLRMHMAPGS
jgi:hypothetical protein